MFPILQPRATPSKNVMMLHTKQAVLTMCIHTYADTLHYEIAILAAIDASQMSQLLFNGLIEEY